MNMKLAEALIERADLQTKIAQLEKRMAHNVKVQEGDMPAEDVEELLPQYERLMDTLEVLIIKINKTNNATSFEDMTLTEAITKRDCLKSKIRVYRDLYHESTISQDRYTRSEIKFVRCVDASKLQNTIDRLSKTYRELDVKMQGLNWTADLVE